jgi:hypothetical protein|tara:strand:+ start:308 stop:496 length:189 start_codon:yes stop_codon:yes gene_type:complete
MNYIDDNTYTSEHVAEAVLSTFMREYDNWERKMERRNIGPPDYKNLAERMYNAYKTAKCYGF